jgi:two-component system CheB/CheR fusion protein
LVAGYLPGMTGLELLQHLQDRGYRLPAIMIRGNSDVTMAVQAMKAGASDFIEKAIGNDELLVGVERALEQSRDTAKLSIWRKHASERVAKLTPRQRQIMEMVLAGDPSKNIAADLNLSQRTVESHRASIMEKMGVKSLPALARLRLLPPLTWTTRALVRAEFWGGASLGNFRAYPPIRRRAFPAEAPQRAPPVGGHGRACYPVLWLREKLRVCAVTIQ